MIFFLFKRDTRCGFFRFGQKVMRVALGADQSVRTFSRRNGELLRTHIRTRYQCQTHGGGSVQLRIGPSRHAMADHLRALELESATPKVVQTTEQFQSLLPAGKPAA